MQETASNGIELWLGPCGRLCHSLSVMSSVIAQLQTLLMTQNGHRHWCGGGAPTAVWPSLTSCVEILFTSRNTCFPNRDLNDCRTIFCLRETNQIQEVIQEFVGKTKFLRCVWGWGTLPGLPMVRTCLQSPPLILAFTAWFSSSCWGASVTMSSLRSNNSPGLWSGPGKPVTRVKWVSLLTYKLGNSTTTIQLYYN